MSRPSSLTLSIALGAVIAAGVAGSGASAAPVHSQSFSFVQVVGGLDKPVYVTSAPGAPTTLYVVQQTGKIRIVRNGHVAGTFLDLTNLISYGGERGLLSMAFSPHYATDHLFYVSYTDANGNSRVARYQAAGGKGVPSSAQIILSLHQPYANHNGGDLQFDKRGYLYIGFGDGGSAGDPNENAQNMKTRLGKLLRSATTTPDGRWRIVGLGLRNPWRYSFDPANDNLWIGDVGQKTWEEIDFRPAARIDALANYGWSRYEGYSDYDTAHTYANVGQKVRPALVFGHVHGQCAITGGYVYRGTAVPAARGRYFYGDLCSGTVWSFRTSAKGRASSRVVSGHVATLSSFGVDGNGNLYAVSLHGTIYELTSS